MDEGWLQVWCYLYIGVITSDMMADPVPISDMIACIAQLYHICVIGSFIQIWPSANKVWHFGKKILYIACVHVFSQALYIIFHGKIGFSLRKFMDNRKMCHFIQKKTCKTVTTPRFCIGKNCA